MREPDRSCEGISGPSATGGRGGCWESGNDGWTPAGDGLTLVTSEGCGGRVGDGLDMGVKASS